MDYEEKNKKFRDIDKSMQKDLKPIFDRLIEKSERNMDSKSPTSWDEYVPPCGITNRNEPMTEEQIRDADNLVDIAITTIMENPRDFPLIEGQVPSSEKGQWGSDAGSDVGRVPLRQVESPDWLNEIESSLKGYYVRKKGRKGMDYEELIKGVIRKPKDKMRRKDDALYVFIDTSGSMWGYVDAYGTPLLELFATFFPEISKKYSGEVWFADYSPYDAVQPVSRVVDLSDFRSDEMNDVVIGGAGGTEFWGVWKYFDKKVREAQEKNTDAKVMMIFFSDMEADFTTYPELINNKNVLFVTVKGKGKEVEHLIDGEDRRLIYADAKLKND
jgi:hypothetical protein